MREIVINTETTGLDPLGGHRAVETGAVELIDHSLTGQTFQCYQCLEHSVLADALAVHGLSAEFLADKPLFAAIADEFLTFVGDAPLVAHDAGFDIAFLNAELNCAAKAPMATKRVIDMLVLARRASIPANTTRSTTYAHAMALIAPAAHNTASTPSCVELTTTRQATLQLEPIKSASASVHAIVKTRPQPLPPRTTAMRTGRSCSRLAPMRFGLTTLRAQQMKSVPVPCEHAAPFHISNNRSNITFQN